MIIVTGATGRLGSAVVEHLLTLVGAEQVGVSVRDPARADGLRARGVRVRRGDFTDPASLAAAFEGAEKVLVVSPDVLGAAGVAQSTAAIDAARAAGVGRVFYTSHQAAAPDALFAPGRDHAAVEAHLAASGLPYTSLRNGYYTESLIGAHLGEAVRTGELIAPVDGPVTWTSRADLAVADAVLLASADETDGPTAPLVATVPVDLDEVAAELSQVIGKAVRRVVVDDEGFVAVLVGRGVPEQFARLFLGTFHAAARGDFAVTDPALRLLLGREPTTVRAALTTTFGGEHC